MDVLTQLARKEHISEVFVSWKASSSVQSVSGKDALRSVLEQRGIDVVTPPVATELSSLDLLTEVLADAMNWAVRVGLTHRQAVEFLRLYVRVLLAACGRLEHVHRLHEDLELNQELPNLHSTVTYFKDHLLPRLTLALSPPSLSTLAVQYIFNTVFTHFHLYQMVVCDGAEMQTEEVSLEIQTIASQPLPLSQGVPEREWNLQLRLESLESDHDARMCSLQESLAREPDVVDQAVGIPLGETGGDSETTTLSLEAVSRIVKSASSETLQQVSARLSQEVDILKEQVDYKSAVVQARIASKK